MAATTPQLQTNTAAVGTVIDNRTVLELPFNARNFYDLIALTPGVIKTRGASSVMDERSAEIGGIRNTSTNAMLDGVDFSVLNINNPAIALSLDTIEEFKVQMNFMDASYGHGAAGIDMVTQARHRTRFTASPMISCATAHSRRASSSARRRARRASAITSSAPAPVAAS